jgi:heme/copper-type cytochrome/quinol oxidase subunit 4
MSKSNIWIILAEKILAIVTIIVGAIMLYYTATSADVLKQFSGMFTAIGAVILIVGILLLIITPKEEEKEKE